MALNDPLADSLSKINNATRALSKKVTLNKSKLLVKILDKLKENNYIGGYKIVEDGKQGILSVDLVGTINSCNVIKPRFPVTVAELESFEQRFLPAKDFGVLIISTNKGLMTQKEARANNIGGTLVAYCY